jgi:glutaredoxin-related protein
MFKNLKDFIYLRPHLKGWDDRKGNNIKIYFVYKAEKRV